MQSITVFLDFLRCDYRIDWKAHKEHSPRIEVRGFIAQGQKNPMSPHAWMSLINVKDSDETELPSKVFVIILVSGEYFNEHVWKTLYGGSSWYAEAAFISKESAEAYIQDKDDQWSRYWILPAYRL